MFGRVVLRTSLRQQSLNKISGRRYASDSNKSTRGNGLLLVGAGALALGAGYWYSQQSVSTTQSSSKSPSGKKVFDGVDGFISLKLQDVEHLSHNTKKFRFVFPEDDMQSGLTVASALLTKYKGPEMDKPAIRPYTPVSDEDAVGYLDLLVKKYPDGVMSTHLHDMTPGQQLEFKGPIPKYTMEPNKHKHICLIAGGTGITPMWQLARYVFSHPEDNTKVTLVFGNVTEQDILLKKELEELENKYPQRFRAFYVLNQPPEEWQGGKGFIDKTLLKTVLPEPKEENIKIFVCGPPGLYKAISGTKKSPKDQGDLSGILKELGYKQDQVFKF